MNRVLVIDDDETARTVVGALLEEAGYKVHAIASPIGASRTIREHDVDAVICDLNMPAMKGDAFARLFRQSRAFKDVRLVLISGASREELAALQHDGTVDAVLHKSELAENLAPLLRRIIRRR